MKRKTDTDRIIDRTNQLIGLFIVVAMIGFIVTCTFLKLYTEATKNKTEITK